MPVLWTREEIDNFYHDFKCLICWAMPTNPYICFACITHYCYECISDAYMMYDLDSCPHCRYYSLVFAIVSQWSRKGLFLFCNCINLLGLYDYLVLIHTYPLECSLLKLSYPGGRCLSTVTFALHFSTSSLVYTKAWYQRALSIRRGSSQSIARTVTKKVATGAGCKYFLLPLRGNPPCRCFSFPDMIDLS